MKYRIFIFLVVCAALIISSCGQKEPLSPGSQELSQSEPGLVPEEALTSALKVVREEFSYPYDLDAEDPWVVCNGELMQEHGIVEVHYTEITTPSGNVIWQGWVDYNAYGGITIEELSTGDTWTLINGLNPFHDMLKENGFYVLAYQWYELFTNPDRGMLRFHLKGHVKVDKDGNVTIERESYRCF